MKVTERSVLHLVYKGPPLKYCIITKEDFKTYMFTLYETMGTYHILVTEIGCQELS